MNKSLDTKKSAQVKKQRTENESFNRPWDFQKVSRNWNSSGHDCEVESRSVGSKKAFQQPDVSGDVLMVFFGCVTSAMTFCHVHTRNSPSRNSSSHWGLLRESQVALEFPDLTRPIRLSPKLHTIFFIIFNLLHSVFKTKLILVLFIRTKKIIKRLRRFYKSPENFNMIWKIILNLKNNNLIIFIEKD